VITQTTGRPIPQLGAALALAALLTEYPTLPALTWSAHRDGTLYGSLADGAALAAATRWEQALGGSLTTAHPYTFDSQPRIYRGLHVVWRDIKLHLAFHADAPAVLLAPAVAA
jgi:hypothetical protein